MCEDHIRPLPGVRLNRLSDCLDILRYGSFSYGQMSSRLEFPDSRLRDCHASLTGVSEFLSALFCVHCPICMKFGTTDLHTMLLGICEFRDNRRREGRPVLTVS